MRRSVCSQRGPRLDVEGSDKTITNMLCAANNNLAVGKCHKMSGQAVPERKHDGRSVATSTSLTIGNVITERKLNKL